MNALTSPAANNDHRILSVSAFALFLSGFIAPFLVVMRVLPDEGLYFAIGAEILAIVFGLLSWRARLSKVAVTGALILFTLGTVNYIRFMSDSRADEEHRRFEQRELQIPGGMKR